MSIPGLGIHLPHVRLDGTRELAEDLAFTRGLEPDFVEIWPQNLGVILGGDLDAFRLREVRELLLEADLAYTVHAPMEVNLMDLTTREHQRDVLDASLHFAHAIGAGTVVCHAGQRMGARDFRRSMREQLHAERIALQEAGDRAAELGILIAVENYYPELPIVRGEVYDYSVWPSELAEQVSAVDHPAVGVCLDVGHAALAAGVFGFDYFEACAAAAPLVRHLHLHDNLRRSNLTGEPPVSEHAVHGLGDLHLPPGAGDIPLRELFRRVDFPEDPPWCVELSPDLYSRAPQALRAAREMAASATRTVTA
jgi:sugar phosphate isomerase/epimerase